MPKLKKNPLPRSALTRSFYSNISKGDFIPPLFSINVRKFRYTAPNGSPESPDFYFFYHIFSFLSSCVLYISTFVFLYLFQKPLYSVSKICLILTSILERLSGNTTVKLVHFNSIASMNIAHAK
jgi:hypothetical protein